MSQTPLSLRAAAVLALQEREHGRSAGIRHVLFTEDAATGDLVAWPDGRRYSREEWSAKVRTAPRAWHGKVYRGVDLDLV